MADNVTHIFGLNETVIRVSAFLLALAAFMLAETLFPRRLRALPRRNRWWTNGAMLVLANLLVRVLASAFPLIIATAAAAYSQQNQIGLLYQVTLPTWIEFAIALLVLDFAIWLQHVASHKVPVFWRFHKVHHSDRDIDTSSALRFHPGEIALSALFKLAVVVLLGPAVLAVIVFEIMLNACAIFNHANLALHQRVDGVLRYVIVTPDMHRVHHSVHRQEQSSNFGFCLSIWDRLLGVYTPQPKDGHATMALGLTDHQSEAPQDLFWSLKLPVTSKSKKLS